MRLSECITRVSARLWRNRNFWEKAQPGAGCLAVVPWECSSGMGNERGGHQEPCGRIRHIRAAPLPASGAAEGGVKWGPWQNNYSTTARPSVPRRGEACGSGGIALDHAATDPGRPMRP